LTTFSCEWGSATIDGGQGLDERTTSPFLDFIQRSLLDTKASEQRSKPREDGCQFAPDMNDLTGMDGRDTG
jgi:hypothetical protein